MYSEVHVGKHLSDNYPIQNGLKQCGPTFSYPRANQIFVYESEGQRH
jgi:hypothetical protein